MAEVAPYNYVGLAYSYYSSTCVFKFNVIRNIERINMADRELVSKLKDKLREAVERSGGQVRPPYHTRLM